MNFYKHAITRNISSNYMKCISFHPLQSNLSIKRALIQHKVYKNTLKELGLDIIELDADINLPDCCFIEDTAIIHNKKALISRMGPITRRKEVEATREILKHYFSLTQVMEPGIIEGGDVIHFKNQLISGLSQRTNLDGIKQAEKWLDVKINSISDPNIVHLKSFISRLDENTILCTKQYYNDQVLDSYVKILVPDSELYAANVLEINGSVLIPKTFPKTKTLLRQNGYDIIELDTSEFQKCEGALTCLSLLF